jgi:hypothetical protein
MKLTSPKAELILYAAEAIAYTITPCVVGKAISLSVKTNKL